MRAGSEAGGNSVRGEREELCAMITMLCPRVVDKSLDSGTSSREIRAGPYMYLVDLMVVTY